MDTEARLETSPAGRETGLPLPKIASQRELFFHFTINLSIYFHAKNAHYVREGTLIEFQVISRPLVVFRIRDEKVIQMIFQPFGNTCSIQTNDEGHTL